MEKLLFMELLAKSPLIITSKKGKGQFYESSDHVPNSTLLGAIAAAFIRYNVKNQVGNCKNLKTPNDVLQCDTCTEQNNCTFYKVWVQKKLSVSPAYPIPSDSDLLWDLDVIHPCYRVKSIVERRLPSESKDLNQSIADNLILTTARKLAYNHDEYVISPRWLLKDPSINGDSRVKGSSFSGIVSLRDGITGSGNDSLIPTEEYLHRIFYRSLALAPNFRSSARGLLYGVFALDAGTRFNALAVVRDEKVTDALKKNNTRVQVGLGKSKGWGQLEINVKKEISTEEFTALRENRIVQGFDEIRTILELKQGCVFTFTFLSPIPVSKILEPSENKTYHDANQKVLDKLIGIQEQGQMIHFLYRIATHTTFISKPDHNFGKIKPHFRVQDVFMPGSAGSVYIPSECNAHQLAALLAKREVELLKENIFVEFNHPIHLVKTTT